MEQEMMATEAPRGSPLGRTLHLMGIVAIAEAAMLGAIFLAHAQNTIPGLVLAVAWPWIAAFVSGRRLLATHHLPKAIQTRRATAKRRLEARML